MKSSRTLFSKYSLALVLIASALLSGCGITTKNLHGHAGYADIESPYWWQADNELNLSIGPSTIRVARWFTDIDDDPQIEALLKDVDGLRVSVYKIDGNEDVFLDLMSETRGNLNATGWQQVVQIKEKEDKETTLMFMKSSGETIDGLVVLILSKEEATFVNVIGNIHPDSFEPLMAQVYSEH
jgi:hypothetical protein